MSARILVVEDEEALTTLLRYNWTPKATTSKPSRVATMRTPG